MASHPCCKTRSLVAVFHAASIQRHFVDGESIDSAVMGIEHRLIDNKHLVGPIRSNKAFGAPAPLSFSIAFHAGGLYDYLNVEGGN